MPMRAGCQDYLPVALLSSEQGDLPVALLSSEQGDQETSGSKIDIGKTMLWKCHVNTTIVTLTMVIFGIY